MNFKKLTSKDRKTVAKLLADYWKERGMPEYNQKWALRYLAEGHKKETVADEFFAYHKGRDLIGVIAFITDVSGVAQIRDLVVKKEYRHMGFGRKILNELIKIARKRKLRKIFVICFPKLKKFYQSAGFEKEGLLKSHFADNENLIIMSKFIK